MNTEKETILHAVDLGYEENHLLPVSSFSKHIVNARCEKPHAHPRAQLIYADKGVMKVVTPKQIWFVNPLQAIWIPGLTQHQVHFQNSVHVKTLFIDSSLADQLPKHCFAFEMSSFLKALVLKIINFDSKIPIDERERRILDVLLDELSELTSTSFVLPLSEDAKINSVINLLIDDLSSDKKIGDYADVACVSTRTLTRLFIKETGMTFNEWRTRLKILEAMRGLGEKKSVSTIAAELGYENTSAFIAMFRKHMGQTPSSYVSNE